MGPPPPGSASSLAYKVQLTFFVLAKKKKELGEQHETRWLLKSHYSSWNIFYLVKMRHSSRNSNVRELNEKKLVDKTITYCFIEWHNMMWLEIYFGSLMIFLEGNQMLGYQP